MVQVNLGDLGQRSQVRDHKGTGGAVSGGWQAPEDRRTPSPRREFGCEFNVAGHLCSLQKGARCALMTLYKGYSGCVEGDSKGARIASALTGAGMR